MPKTLGALRSRWAPAAFVVSFKLETDQAILLDKASGVGWVFKGGLKLETDQASLRSGGSGDSVSGGVVGLVG